MTTPASSAGFVVNARYASVRPLAVVQPVDAADVARVVGWARRKGVRLAARSGGHSYAGYSTTTGVVADLRRIDAVTVNTRTRTATVGAGAHLIDVIRVLAAHGVAIPHGSCPSVGVGGLALGGGVGFASRAWGTTSDNVLALRLVTADGRVRNCSPRENADLYWACRGGGGGNFGVATSFTLRVHPVRSVSWFVADWPWSQVDEVVRAWTALMPDAPDALFSICSLNATPHVEVSGQFLGAESALRRVLAPLRAVGGISLRTGTSTYLDAQLRWAGCLGRTIPACTTAPHLAFAATSAYFDRPLSAAARATLRRQLERPGAGAILLDSYGGALNRPAPGATAFVHRNELFSAQYYASGSSSAWIHAARAALAPHSSGSAYQNYIDRDLPGWRRAYYGANLGRLEAVKRHYDPDRFFRFPQAI